MIQNIYNAVRGWFIEVLTFFKDVFNGMWEALKSLFTDPLQFVIGGVIDIVSWFWSNIIHPTVNTLFAKIDSLPFDSMLAQIPITQSINANFVNNFINVNLVVSLILLSLGFLISLALFKFSIKLIPTVG